MKVYIISGVLLLLVWLFLYFKYFREKEERSFLINLRTRKVDQETTYFVSPLGDDNNTGSPTSPWKTLQHAVNRLQPGDKLLIREGIYKEYVSLKKSGTNEKTIFIGVFQGEEAVLDGEGVPWKYGFNFEYEISFVTLAGLKIKNFEEYGVALWGENRSVQMLELEVLGCGTGLHIVSAENLLIEGCNFHNNSGPGLVVSPGPLKSARIVRTISSYNESPKNPDGFMLDSGADISIDKCVTEYNTGSGFNCHASSATISASIARGNDRYGIKCVGEKCKLVNCIIDNNGVAGVSLQGGGFYELYNNLVAKCGLRGDYGLSANPEACDLTARISLVNNIFAYNYGGVHLGSSVMLEKEDYNIYWSREDAEISVNNRKYSRDEINERFWFKETGRGEHSFCRDPLFVDPSRNDFRLAKNSPAIDRGTREGAPATDIDGNNRPQGWGIDIGPYESAERSFVPPSAVITHVPDYSSDSSNSLKFHVKWAGFMEGGEVARFNVQYKDGIGGTWQNWLAATEKDEGEFWGASGHTYYFRVRARDDLGNWGNWSDYRCTVVPTDDQSPLIKYEGDWDLINSEEAYLNTLHHSACPNSAASFRFTGTEIAWISTRGPDRGQAMVYIDNVLHTEVDLYCADNEFRRPVFSACLDGGTHIIRVEVSGTNNRLSKGCRVDIDGFAVKL